MPAVNPRKVLDGVVDLVVYAPVGVAATVVEELPALVAKGKSRLVMARTIGQFAVAMGRQRVEKAVADRRARPGAAPEAPAEPPGEGDAGAAAAAAGAAASEPAAEAGGADAGDGPADGGVSLGALDHVAHAGGGPQADGLAIPGYDSLAASQVVQRLAGLSPAELEAVRDYEEATRGRRTILGRIAQLSAAPGEPAGG